MFLSFIASKSLKLCFTLNCVLKPANDLKMISNRLILLLRCVRNLKPFRVNRIIPGPVRHSRDINKYLANLVFLVRTVSYGSSFFLLCVWAINRRGKNLVRNLKYGPRTRLVRGIYRVGLSHTQPTDPHCRS